ncbi:MAG: DUF5134 domain-containing protein [Arthrobacter sp.]
MIANDVARWGLTALLLAASLFAVFQASRKSPPATRVEYCLHAAMLAAMAAMLVPGVRWPALPQIMVFGLAAWWFVLRAVSRRPMVLAVLNVTAAGPWHGRREGEASRGRLLYNALTMAAMAYMLAVMDLRGTHRTPAAPTAAGLADLAAHHGGSSARPSLAGSFPAALPEWTSLSAPVLAVAFGAAGAVWGVLLLRRARRRNRTGSGAPFLELVSAVSMAVMFAAFAV